MQCPACDRVNPEGSRFCNGCGAELPLRCGACGRINPPGSAFCNACGASLTAPSSEPVPAAAHSRADADPRSYTPRHLAERILTQKAALEGERKHVTVLFADLADSTALVEHLGDPEVMHALLDQAFQLILEQVHGYEGTINQFTGDGVMALFGAPLALEDAPRRAVVAALAIQRELEAFDRSVRETHGRPFRMRIGIHSGPVVVGRIGDDLRMDYTAIGDTTHLAARLEAAAEPGSVLISEATRRLVEGYFDVEALGPIEVKGKTDPVAVHRVVADRAVGGRVDLLSSEEGLTPHVGRDHELAALVAAFERARDGRGQVAFVVGEAGIGKSRLLYEFRRAIAAESHEWVEGRCASYAQASPFYALADAVRRSNGIDDRDDESKALEKLLAREERLGGGLAWTLPFVRGLLSLPSGDAKVDALDALSRRNEMSRALHARMLRSAEQRPQVIVMEDLHWVDTATEEYLAFIADAIPAAPVLLVVTHRPGYEHPFGDRSYHVRVPLQPLSESAMSDMATSVLAADELPPALRRLIVEKAEGNPLFVEEVAASLLEEGVLRLEGRRLSLTRDLAEVSIPDRIQDVLMARLDRLPDAPRSAIQMASVIGREFAMRLLDRIHEATDRLDDIVGELRALELIYEKASHPELAYMFKHALTHEVAYESILVARRKALHRIVGAAIEELYADRIAEHYEALAHHFGQSDDPVQAFRYHLLASEKCATAYANHAAIEHCREALDLADRLETVSDDDRFALQLRLGQCGYSTSAFRASAEAYEAAAAIGGDTASSALLLARAAWSHLWDHTYDRGQDALERCFAAARRHTAPAAESYGLVVEDEYRLVQGQDLDDDRRVLRAVELAEASGNASVLVMALGQVTQRAEWNGDYRRAIDFGTRAVALAQRENMQGETLFAGWFLGIARICLGEYAEGFAGLQGGIELCDRIGDRAIKARLLNTLGWAYAEVGAAELAAGLNRGATEIAREAIDLGLFSGAPELYANAAINLTGNLLVTGRIEEAEATLAPIQAQYDTDPDPWMRWRWSLHLLHAQAGLALAKGDPEAALVIANSELAAAEVSGAAKLLGRARAQRGRIRLVMDDREGASRELEAAIAIAGRIEQPSLLWRARSLHAELLRRQGANAAADAEVARFRSAIAALAPGIVASTARRDFEALAERLATDPLGSHR